jgi:hypothetical protein
MPDQPQRQKADPKDARAHFGLHSGGSTHPGLLSTRMMTRPSSIICSMISY